MNYVWYQFPGATKQTHTEHYGFIVVQICILLPHQYWIFYYCAVIWIRIKWALINYNYHHYSLINFQVLTQEESLVQKHKLNSFVVSFGSYVYLCVWLWRVFITSACQPGRRCSQSSLLATYTVRFRGRIACGKTNKLDNRNLKWK